MTTTCPKCAYQRKAVEDAPDWKCPSCGVAYNKVIPFNETAALRTRSGSTRIPTAPEPSNRRIKLMAGILIAIVVTSGIWKWKHTSTEKVAESRTNELEEATKHLQKGDINLAISLLTQLAERGNIKACYYLGGIFQNAIFNGQIQEQSANIAKALSWYEKAAVLGDVASQMELAKMYQKGLTADKQTGSNTDYINEAKYWFKKVAEHHDAEAQYQLGLMAEKTSERDSEFRGKYGWEQYKLIQRDYPEAQQWYRLAAEQGHPGGLYRLAKLYAQGLGVTANKTTAYALFLIAVKKHANNQTESGAFWAQSWLEILDKKTTAEERQDAKRLAATIEGGGRIPD